MVSHLGAASQRPDTLVFVRDGVCRRPGRGPRPGSAGLLAGV